MSDWTVGKVLAWTAKDLLARGIDSPRLDAELLIARALKLRRIDLYLRHDQALGPDELAAVRALVERRRLREPVAYILGEREFYGRTFTVDRRVLVPRPETEHMVDAALEHLRAWEGEALALDLGTGSGAIAVTLAAELPGLRVDAVDLSPDALAVARENAGRLGVAERVGFFEGDLYAPIEPAPRYALIASNPPYVLSGEVDGLMPEVSAHEPRMALDGGADGLDAVREVVRGANDRLHPGGVLLIEIGDGQGEAAREMAEGMGLAEVSIQRDLARRERLLRAKRR